MRCLLLLVAMVSPAYGQAADIPWENETPETRSLREQLTMKLGHLSNHVGFHVGRLSLAAIGVGFDVDTKKAQFNIGGASNDTVGVALHNNIKFERGYARIDAALNVSFLGERWRLELPTVDLATTSVRGQRAVELRLPFIHGRF